MTRPLWDIWQDMHRITSPGDYGLGQEPDSYPDDDKGAWIRMGQLVEELSEVLVDIDCGNPVDTGWKGSKLDEQQD